MRSRLMQYRSDPLMQYHSGVDIRSLEAKKWALHRKAEIPTYH